MDEIPRSIISHVSVGTNDFAKAKVFYDAVMASLGFREIMQHEDAVAYGYSFPEFWLQTPFDGKAANVGNGCHVAFMAESREDVHKFYDKALEMGAKDDGPPGPRPPYGAAYYGCFVRDLDGNKIEAMYWDAEKA